MPSGNIQRTVQSFISTVVSSTANGNPAAPADNTPRGNQTTSRRTVGNGSWIINDLQSSQQQLQETMDSVYSDASMFQIHSRQSAGADMDLNFHGAGEYRPQILSPRDFQIPSAQSQTSEMIDNFIESELQSAAASYRNNVEFDVTDLNQAGAPLQQLQQILRGASNIQNNLGVNPAATSRPSNNALRNKIVYKLNCTYCKVSVCERAMRAILLADTKVELYSTDIPPKAVVTMNEDRMTGGCNCKIRDTVCTGCGNVLGYHVSQPCDRCLDARNNGHFWMFCSEGITASERIHYDGNGPLYWAALSPMCDFVPASNFVANGQSGNSGYESFCR